MLQARGSRAPRETKELDLCNKASINQVIMQSAESLFAHQSAASSEDNSYYREMVRAI